MLQQLRGWEWLIIAALVMVLFGYKKLPDAARGLGQSLKILKSETKGIRSDEPAESSTTTAELSEHA